MWIIPSTHPLYSAFAPDFLDSKEDLNELSGNSVSWPTWKSKPSSLPTWLRAWKRVYWIPHLFGRMLKPSMQNLFVEKYTASLVDIRAHHSALPETEGAPMIHDTFFRIYLERLKQLDLFGASSKTLVATSHWDMTKFTEALEILVTQLRQDYTVRQKRAHHMKENDYSSSAWPTPTGSETEGGDNQKGISIQNGRFIRTSQTTGQIFGAKLRDAVNQKWNTPDAQDYKHPGVSMSKRQLSRLNKTVTLNWPTPSANEDSYRITGNSQQSNSLSGMMRREVIGQHHQGPNSSIGKSRAQLNPAWVAQLMGTTLGKTFYVPMATAWLNKLPKSHS